MTKLEEIAQALAAYWHEHSYDPSQPDGDVARAAVVAMRKLPDNILRKFVTVE